MLDEQREHELSLLGGKGVSIVRPFGQQSDSYAGSLIVRAKEYPTVFEFQSHIIAIRFRTTDVTKVKGNVIYLKGLTDYMGDYQTSHS